MKTCNACHEAKPLTEFYTHKKSGHSYSCKDCDRAAARDRMRRKRQDADFRQRERDAVAVARATDPDRFREYGRRHKQNLGYEDRTDQMPAFDLTKPISYETAHYRVARWRGRASIHQCECGAQAHQWAYRKNSPHEQVGTTHSARGDIEVRFSPDPMDYDPMCRSCHTRFDRQKSRYAIWLLPVG